MLRSGSTRRQFLRLGMLSPIAQVVPYWYSTKKSQAADFQAASERPNIGLIGVGGRGTNISKLAASYGNIVAICDVDLKHAEAAQATFGGQSESLPGLSQLT